MRRAWQTSWESVEGWILTSEDTWLRFQYNADMQPPFLPRRMFNVSSNWSSKHFWAPHGVWYQRRSASSHDCTGRERKNGRKEKKKRWRIKKKRAKNRGKRDHEKKRKKIKGREQIPLDPSDRKAKKHH